MVRSYGSLLAYNAYTPETYDDAVAARAAYEAGQPATFSLDKKYPLIACCGDMVSDPDLNDNRDQLEGSAIAARFKSVSDLVVNSNCTFFCCLGDNVYEDGQLANYLYGYANTFGRVDDKCLPIPGNHEYQTPEGADYYEYFGHKAGVPGRGYYAVNIANWRWYSLNSNSAGMVAAGSVQALWFEADMAAHADRPKVVAWHHPRWTDGATGAVADDNNYDHLWQLMYADGNVQVALAGHDHNYQRWDTIKSAGTGANPATVADGITQFVVGCGGHNFFNLIPLRNTGGPGNANRSTYGHDRAFGVLFLRLGPTSWDWMFKGIDGTVHDEGNRAIH